MFKTKTKEVKLEEGYAVIRQLTPLDQIHISKILGDELNNDSMVENAIVASSIVAIKYPDYNRYPNPSDYMIVDEEFEGNYTQDADGNKVLKEKEELLMVLDPAKSVTVIFDKPIKELKEINERMIMSIGDWTIIASHSLQLNEPNPNLLGKSKHS